MLEGKLVSGEEVINMSGEGDDALSRAKEAVASRDSGVTSQSLQGRKQKKTSGQSQKEEEAPTSSQESSEEEEPAPIFKTVIFDGTLTEEVPSGEILGYFYHMWKHYNNLADVTLFLHPDNQEHVRDAQLRRAIDALNGDGTWNFAVFKLHRRK